MSHNFNNHDDATTPIPHRPLYQPPGSQGPIVLGGFSQQKPNRQAPTYEPGTHNQKPYGGVVPPHYPPQQLPNSPYQPHGLRSASPPVRRRSRHRVGCGILLVVFVVLLVLFFTAFQKFMAFGSAISNKAPLATETSFLSTNERTNLLMIGYGGGTHEGANLTDSLAVVSLKPQSRHTSLVSLPRDLWVQYPADSGIGVKINSIYSIASNNGEDRISGGDALAEKVSLVTGLDTQYWLMIDFNGFEKLIDSIGGIDVYVPTSFTADYPKNDDPTIDASWETIRFEKGNMYMDGKTAIKYARARYVLDNDAEGTDFARAARQQIIMKATLNKMQQVTTWPSLFSAMDAMKDAVYTNMPLIDLALFAKGMDLNDPNKAQIGLQDLMVDSFAPDGQWIVSPRDGDWEAVKQYIQSHLYE